MVYIFTLKLNYRIHYLFMYGARYGAFVNIKLSVVWAIELFFLYSTHLNEFELFHSMIFCFSIPKILLENSKGLSLTVLQELHDKLEKRAKELVGEEMIFQLSQYVQEFLHKHNKPTSKSFYDEMLQRQKEQQEKDLQAQKIEEDRQVSEHILLLITS